VSIPHKQGKEERCLAEESTATPLFWGQKGNRLQENAARCRDRPTGIEDILKTTCVDGQGGGGRKKEGMVSVAISERGYRSPGFGKEKKRYNGLNRRKQISQGAETSQRKEPLLEYSQEKGNQRKKKGTSQAEGSIM